MKYLFFFAIATTVMGGALFLFGITTTILLAWAAIVGGPGDLAGEAVCAFVSLLVGIPVLLMGISSLKRL